jgi:hypothetical protein
LRLIDVADLVSMLRFERNGDLSDLVASAAELFFLPGTITLGIGGRLLSRLEAGSRASCSISRSGRRASQSTPG